MYGISEARIEKLEKMVQRIYRLLKKTDSTLESISESSFNSNRSGSESDMECYVMEPDPPMQTIPVGPIAQVASTLVWPLLRDWLARKDEEGSRRGRFARFLKFIDARNLRQALFERNKKAESKYGEGLSMEVGGDGLQTGVEKLSDAVYFLFKTTHCAESLCNNNPNEFKRQLDLVTDLHNVLGTFVLELKDVNVRRSVK